MEPKKIKLRICNQEVVVSIDGEQEHEFRQHAKNINDDFSRYKERYGNVEDEKLMAFLLLQSRVKSQKQASTNPKQPSIFKRFLEYFKAED